MALLRKPQVVDLEKCTEWRGYVAATCADENITLISLFYESRRKCASLYMRHQNMSQIASDNLIFVRGNVNAIPFVTSSAIMWFQTLLLR